MVVMIVWNDKGRKGKGIDCNNRDDGDGCHQAGRGEENRVHYFLVKIQLQGSSSV